MNSETNTADQNSPRDGGNGAVLPLIVLSAEGQVVDLLQTNEKGFKKSTERGTLWLIDPDTGRLLPDPAERPLDGMHAGERWYVARLQPQADARPGATPPAGAAPPESTTARPGPDAPAQRAGSPRPEAATPGGARPTADQAAAAPDFSVLAELWAVIRKRNAERPAGSYTTHLFSEGEEKIRKKTGEEAVELLLARSREELTHESADLVYHLLVLLEATGIGVEALLTELGSR